LPNYSRHFRVTYSGTLGPDTTPVEEWAFNVSMGLGGSLAIPTREVLTDYAAGCRVPYSEILNAIQPTARLRRVRVAAIGTDGKVLRDAGGAFLQGDWLGNVPGGSSVTAAQPSYVALTVSLRTTLADPCGRGRFYLPSPGLALGADLRLTTQDQTNHTARAQAFLNGLNAFAANNAMLGKVCVASGGSTVKGIAPANREVISVHVGRVPDVIRRRRNQLVEEYSAVAVA
jgi:hypothetical protein